MAALFIPPKKICQNIHGTVTISDKGLKCEKYVKYTKREKKISNL